MTSEIRRFSLTIVALGVTLAASKAIDGRPPESLAQPLNTIPLQIQDWRGVDDPPIRGDILASLDASSYLSRTYQRGAETLNLFIAYYANQKAGESMHSPKHCLPGSGWEFLSYNQADLRAGAVTIPVNEDLIQKDGARMSVLYWYQSRRRVVAGEYRAKLFLIRDAVVERHTGGAIVRLMCPGRVDACKDFAMEVFPSIKRVIGDDTR
jgi:EpsI family protein